MIPYVGIVVHVPGQEFGREQGEEYHFNWEFLMSQPALLTKFPGMVYCPTVIF